MRDLWIVLEKQSNTILLSLNLQFDKPTMTFHKLNRELRLEPTDTVDWEKDTLIPVSAKKVARYRADESVKTHALIYASTSKTRELIRSTAVKSDYGKDP
jgi:hypothetical protein